MGSEKRTLKFSEGQDSSKMPGPGNYDHRESKDVKTYTFGAKSKIVYNQNPGPGAYDADTIQLRDSSRTYVIGSEKRTLRFAES